LVRNAQSASNKLYSVLHSEIWSSSNPGLMPKFSWKQVEHIVDTYLDLPEKDRSRFLKEACSGNQRLELEVETLLASIHSSDDFFSPYQKAKTGLISRIGPNDNGEAAEPDYTGKIFGNYRVVRKLGSGGMGSVYLAERDDGRFEHQVAIKVIRRVQPDPKTAAYFNREQQILARLTHEGIARLYDGGLTPEGTPYLIMELLDGEPIDKYCDRLKLSIHQRVHLFIKVCRAVQYAHSKLVIHRDLKAENILVTKSGNVKILDFGISTLQINKTEAGEQNQNPAFLTPKTTAPECFTGKGITTATDIYSLGLLLYVLVSGTHPVDFENKTFDEIVEFISTQKLPPVPIRYKNLSVDDQLKNAENRNTSIRKLLNTLESDLNYILQKALRKNSDERYHSVAHFSQDLENYITGHTVSAADNTPSYRAKKFIQRNRAYVTIAAVFFITIISGSLLYSIQITTERDNANFQAQKAEETASFLLGLFEFNLPEVSQGRDITAYEILEKGYEQALNLNDPQLQASMMTTIGNAFSRLSEFDTGQEILSMAIEKSHEVFGELSVEKADALYAMGLSHSDNHMWHLAKPYYRESLSIYSDLLPENHPKVARAMSRVGMAHRQLGEPDSALVYSEKAYEIMQANHSFRHPDLLQSMNEYGFVISAINPEKAEEIFLDVIARHIEAGHENDYRLASPYNNLAFLYRNMERYPEAADYYRKSLEISSNTLGDDHRYTYMVRTNLLTPLFHMGLHGEAEEILQYNIEVNRNRYTENHWRTGGAYGAYGSYMMQIGEYEKATDHIHMQYKIYTEQLGADHIWTSYARGALAANQFFLGNQETATELYNNHITVYEERYPDFNNDHRSQINRLIRFYQADEEKYSDIIDRYRQLLQ
jgi:eukaryotic-like serine/threonine-protein kinase